MASFQAMKMPKARCSRSQSAKQWLGMLAQLQQRVCLRPASLVHDSRLGRSLRLEMTQRRFLLLLGWSICGATLSGLHRTWRQAMMMMLLRLQGLRLQIRSGDAETQRAIGRPQPKVGRGMQQTSKMRQPALCGTLAL